MPETINITIDTAALFSFLGVAALLLLGWMSIRFAIRSADICLSDYTAGAADWLWLHFKHEPMMRAGLRDALKDGYQRGDDPFEFLAASRDMVMDEVVDMLGDDPDASDLSTILTYMRRAEVLDINVITAQGTTDYLITLFSDGIAARTDSLSLPDSVASIFTATKAPQDRVDTARLGQHLEEELAALFGNTPDICALAGLALALESSHLIDAVRITVRPGHRETQAMLDQLLLRDPDTGRPLVSIAEMDFLGAF